MFRPASARSVVPHLCAWGIFVLVLPVLAQPRLRPPPIDSPADSLPGEPVEDRPQVIEPEGRTRVIEPDPLPFTSDPLPLPVTPEALPRPRTTLRVSESGDANLQLVVPEKILNQILGVGRTETVPVRDCILGANVLGEQTAVTSLAIDFHPNPAGVHATMRLQGQVNTQTLGRTQQAGISTVGRHQVFASKEIYFDGKLFSTRPAVVQAQVRSTNVGATTRFDGVPLMNGFARTIAINTANSRQRQSEPIVWQRVATQVFRKFNGEVDRQLADANRAFNDDVRPKLQTLSFLPDREHVSTTDTHLTYSALLRDGDLPSVVPPADLSDSQITLRVHDSLLHQAIDALMLNGRSFQPDELTALVEQVVTTIGGRIVKDMAPEESEQPPPAVRPVPGFLNLEPSLIFAERDAVQCEFGEEGLLVTLVARVDLAGRSIVPEQRIRIRFRSELFEDEVFLRRAAIDLEPVEESSPQMQQMYLGLVRPRVEESVADVAFPRGRQLPAPVTRALRIERIDSQTNWLIVEIGVR